MMHDVVITRAVRADTDQKFHACSLTRLMHGMVRSAVDVSVTAYVGGLCLLVL